MQNGTVTIDVVKSPGLTTFLSDLAAGATRQPDGTMRLTLDEKYAAVLPALFEAVPEAMKKTPPGSVTLEKTPSLMALLDETEAAYFVTEFTIVTEVAILTESATDEDDEAAFAEQFFYCDACSMSVAPGRAIVFDNVLLCDTCLMQPFLPDDYPTARTPPPATEKQLKYLRILGWRRESVPTRTQAKRLISALKTVPFYVRSIAQDHMEDYYLDQGGAAMVVSELLGDWPAIAAILQVENARREEAGQRSMEDDNRKAFPAYKPPLKRDVLYRKVERVLLRLNPGLA